ncbi:MAG: DUF308 domain-containing protein [Bacteroidaceae bacterium]|nr:DUF308 domain-containing protein [Bacteroidaceae bacterium]
MPKFNPSFYRIMIALIVGLVLVIFPQNAADYLVIAVGVIFMLPSIFSLVSHFTNRGEMRPPFPVDALGGFLFGLMLIIMPGFFNNILTIVLGFVLTMAGVQQIASLIAARQWVPVPIYHYIMPVTILLAGIFSLTNPVGVRTTLFKVLGVFFLLYAIFEFTNWFFFMRKRPKYENEGAKTGQSILEKMGVDEEDVQDVEIIEED